MKYAETPKRKMGEFSPEFMRVEESMLQSTLDYEFTSLQMLVTSKYS